MFNTLPASLIILDDSEGIINFEDVWNQIGVALDLGLIGPVVGQLFHQVTHQFVSGINLLFVHLIKKFRDWDLKTLGGLLHVNKDLL